MGEVAKGNWAMCQATNLRLGLLFFLLLTCIPNVQNFLLLPCTRHWFKFDEASCGASWSQVWREDRDLLVHCSSPNAACALAQNVEALS
jgi:hypothetical protein